jgi:16S rRNA processing protein RimM
LIGLAAVREDGTPMGRVKAVYDFGAGNIIELEGEAGNLMLPFNEDVVPEVDLEGKRIVIAPPLMTGSQSDLEAEAAEDLDDDEDDAEDGDDEEAANATRH